MEIKSEAIEEYLEAIYKLREAGTARQADLAKHLELSPTSVSEMVKKLIDLKLVERNGSVLLLTAAGESEALAVIRRHRLSERFLTDYLGLPWDKAHEEACKFEHIISAAVENGLEELLDNPDSCPHGHPIPDKSGKIKEVPSRPLAGFGASSKVVIVKVFEDDPEMLKYLATLGLLPDVEIIIKEVGPFNGPLLISVGAAQYALGREVAQNIMVREVV
jgi:DtxR family Mn-dependent transcriptional regulator